MFKKFSSVLFLQGLSLACGLGKTIILGRQLSEYDFGLYSLLLALIGFSYPISLLGQRNAIVRFCSNHKIKSYHLKQYFHRLITISSILIVVFTTIAVGIYNFRANIVFFLLIAIISSAIIEFVPSFIRTQGRIVQAFLLLRGVNLLTFALSLYFLFVPNLGIDLVLWFYGGAFLTLGIAVFFIGNSQFKHGPNPIPKSLWTNGYLLLGSDLALLVMVSIDKFIIPRMLSFESLALYFAIISIFKIFDIILQAANFVLLPYIKKLRKHQLLRAAFVILLSGTLIFIAYIVLGPWLVDIAFKGKYNAGVYLIPILGFARVFQFFYVLPESFLTIRADKLNSLFALNMLTIVISIILTIYLTMKYGLAGAATSLAIVWFIRFAGASGLVLHQKKQ